MVVPGTLHGGVEHPPGHIGVASYFLGRYREFDYCLARTEMPQGSASRYYISVDVCHNFNLMCRVLMENPQFEWLWILGDDHLFNPDLLIKLLDREVDVVVPLCCRRMAPYFPVLHNGPDYGPEGKWASVTDPWGALKGKTGLLDWEGTTGNAGMLIRRHVLEAMSDPWFESGKTNPGVGGSDIYFWHKLRQQGFKGLIDLDNIIGHITHAAIWPHQDEETGGWTYEMRSP